VGEKIIKEVEGINKSKTDPKIIERLEELLESAKSGDLASVMIIDLYFDGTCGSGWAGPPNMQMVGHMEELKLDFLNEINRI